MYSGSKDIIKSLFERIKTLHSDHEVECSKDLSALWEGVRQILLKIADKTVTGEYKLEVVINQGGVRSVHLNEHKILK